VVTADDGVTALEKIIADKERFDLLLLDFYLPKKNAQEVSAQLRDAGLTKHGPIVVLSSHVSAAQRRDLLASGVHDVLRKPDDLNGYAELARRLLDYVGDPR